MPATKRATQKSATSKDQLFGNRVRARRMLLGMSQEKLGDALGITFQQVQKYEKGTNRISASRLEDIAKALDTTVGYFFGTGRQRDKHASGVADNEPPPYVADLPLSSEGFSLVRAFARIKDAKVRKRFVALAQALATGSEQGDTDPSD